MLEELSTFLARFALEIGSAAPCVWSRLAFAISTTFAVLARNRALTLVNFQVLGQARCERESRELVMFDVVSVRWMTEEIQIRRSPFRSRPRSGHPACL